MSWRDHATPVPDTTNSAQSSWRQHATPVVEAARKPADDEQPGILSKIASAVDSVTGAPTRAAIGALQAGQNPLGAAAHQFLRNPETAPTGTDIAANAGVSREMQPPGYGGKSGRLPVGMSNAEIVGGPITMAADPTNLLPLISALKAGKLGEYAASGLGKVGHAFTGLPARDIETYAKATPEVNQMIKGADGNISNAADAFREKIQDSIQGTRRFANGEISQALATAPKDKNVDIKPIIDAMYGVRERINPALGQEAMAQIDEQIARLERLKAGSSNGMVSIQDAQDAKQFLMGRGKKAYLKDGQMFQTAPEAAQSAKAGGAQAKSIMDTAGPADIKSANAKLAGLHDIEENINPNLITPEKPDGALFQALSGGHARNAQTLEDLGQQIGMDIPKEGANLSAARSFMDPPVMPVDSTGKSAARMGLGFVAGKAAGHYLGIPGLEYAGAAMTSPAALKLGINAGRGVMGAGEKLGQAVQGLETSAKMNVAGHAPIVPAFAGKDQDQTALLEKFKQQPELIDSITDPKLKEILSKHLNREPAKGAGQESVVQPEEARQRFLEAN
jgi:hypothetical protein